MPDPATDPARMPSAAPDAVPGPSSGGADGSPPPNGGGNTNEGKDPKERNTNSHNEQTDKYDKNACGCGGDGQAAVDAAIAQMNAANAAAKAEAQAKSALTPDDSQTAAALAGTEENNASNRQIDYDAAMAKINSYLPSPPHFPALIVPGQ